MHLTPQSPPSCNVAMVSWAAVIQYDLESLKMFHIDPEKLISAVKARPSLYNKNYKMYYANKNQNHVKEMLWLEVTEEVLELTDPLLKDKFSFVSEVQKRWRSLRSCFAREVAIQKIEDARRADGNKCIKRRKKYEYFDSMLFLKGETEIEGNTENGSKLSGSRANEHVYLYDGYSVQMVSDIKSEASDESDYEIKDTKRVSENNDNVKIDTAKKRKIQEHDEDKQFALSIVPSLRKLDTKSNLEAKIQILKAIQAVTSK